MASLDDIRNNSSPAALIEGQPQHLLIAILLTLGAASLLTAPDSRILGLAAPQWARVSISLALLHQVLVAVVFRLQLHRGTMTRLFGANDMRVWAALFLPLLIARPVTVILTGWADDVPITGWRGAEVMIGLALLGTAIWAMHSTLVHFTLPRALGGDHFREEIARMPMVDKGVFRYTANGMYGVAFLGLWGIALLFGSWNALVLALFQHAYIWVHMYCTEAPDMARIHGPVADTHGTD